MNFNNPLDYILGQLSKVRILRFLILTGVPMNGREIGKAVGLSHVQTHTALKDLVEQGIVSLRKVGRSNLYELQKEHLVVSEWLNPLILGEKNLKRRLAETVIKALSTAPSSLLVFGSVARREEKAGSDIDLLIVMPDHSDLKKTETELESAGEEVSRLFGNRLSPLIISRTEVLRRRRGRDAFLREVMGGAEVIFGATIPELLADER
jgi:predicted nucleotidyltransferase